MYLYYCFYYELFFKHQSKELPINLSAQFIAKTNFIFYMKLCLMYFGFMYLFL